MAQTETIASYAPVAEHRTGAVGRSLVHTLTLAIVWLTIAMSGVVFSEPAPFDVLMIGLIVLLPIAGLSALTPTLVAGLALILIMTAAGALAAPYAYDVARASSHTFITLYLSIASVVLAGFVIRSPVAHARLILIALVAAAVLSSIAGLVGYFSLVPGAGETFTLFGRVRGTFKDPNVFGAFLVPAILYLTNVWLNQRPLKAIVPLAISGFLLIALLLSFSRGAWANVAIALLVFGYLTFVTAQSNRRRFRLIVVAVIGLVCSAAIVVAAIQFNLGGDLLAERSTLTQSYDQGPEGRFGGQTKALNLILTHPLGIGALQFTGNYHPEDVHNVYLSMFMNAGWIGGFIYLALVIATLWAGARHALRRGPGQDLFLVVFAAFAGTALEGLLIDTDHWRHFFILVALVWGMVIGGRRSTGNSQPQPIPGAIYSAPMT